MSWRATTPLPNVTTRAPSSRRVSMTKPGTSRSWSAPTSRMASQTFSGGVSITISLRMDGMRLSFGHKTPHPAFRETLSPRGAAASPDVPRRHPLQQAIPHDQRVKQDGGEVSREREEEQVRQNAMRLPEHGIERRAVRKNEGQMERPIQDDRIARGREHAPTDQR